MLMNKFHRKIKPLILLEVVLVAKTMEGALMQFNSQAKSQYFRNFCFNDRKTPIYINETKVICRVILRPDSNSNSNSISYHNSETQTH